MGSGRYMASTSVARLATRQATNTSAFTYNETTRHKRRTEWKVHPDLDPYEVENRESRDSDEHPTSLAVAVLFDETGSMRRIPGILLDELPTLYNQISQGGYLEHPQILFGAIGDATSDRVPIQIGQFESDNRFEDNIEKFFLEGNGGSQKTESYELAMYFMARHTDLDCFNKRNEKGYLFIVGDEKPYPYVKATEVAQHIGDGLQEDVDFDTILSEVQAKYNFYFIIPQGSSNANNPEIVGFWSDKLGDNLLRVDSVTEIADAIGNAIAVNETRKDLATTLKEV